MAEVAVVGAGYVGIVTGASLARIGHRVTCVDRDGARISGLREGRMPVYEPGLGEMVARGVEAGRLSFAVALDPAVALADVVFIAVDTPQGRRRGRPLQRLGVAGASGGPCRGAGERPLWWLTSPYRGERDYVSVIVREGADEVGGPATPKGPVRGPPTRFLREGAPSTTVVPGQDRGRGEEGWVVEACELYGPVIGQSFRRMDPARGDGAFV